MARQKSDAQLWRPAHVLAAELAQWGTDANLVRSAAAVMKDDPATDFSDWLDRLVRLGDLFRSSDQTERYRQQLRHVCQGLQERYDLRSGEDWAWVLAWAGRLMPHYQAQRAAAERVSSVTDFSLPPLPPPFRRPSGRQTRLPVAVQEVPVSQKAEDWFAKFQQRGKEQGKK